jgi:hypothetical protein
MLRYNVLDSSVSVLCGRDISSILLAAYYFHSAFRTSHYRWDFSTLPNPKLVGGLVIVWGLISYLTWRFCGSRHIDRKFCGTNYVGLSTAFNARQLRKIQQKRFAGVATSVDERFDIVGRFFLGLMEKYRPVPICTVISGIVYQSVCPGILMTLKSRGINLLVFLGLLCFSSYYPAKMIDFIVWLIPAMMITGSDLQVHSTLLLIRGRMERYASAITSFLINSGLGLLCLFIMLMAIRLLAPIMPPVHLVGKEFSFHVVDWQLWPIFIGVVPISVMLRLIFGNNPAFMSLLMGLLFPFFIIGNLAKPIQSFMQNHWNPMMTGLLLVCIWGVFAAYLYRVCFYKDLGAERN